MILCTYQNRIFNIEKGEDNKFILGLKIQKTGPAFQYIESHFPNFTAFYNVQESKLKMFFKGEEQKIHQKLKI